MSFVPSFVVLNTAIRSTSKRADVYPQQCSHQNSSKQPESDEETKSIDTLTNLMVMKTMLSFRETTQVPNTQYPDVQCPTSPSSDDFVSRLETWLDTKLAKIIRNAS